MCFWVTGWRQHYYKEILQSKNSVLLIFMGMTLIPKWKLITQHGQDMKFYEMFLNILQ